MAHSGNKSVLLVLRHSPYGSSLAKAAVDVALATAAFSQAIDLLFLGDGVLQLIPDQDGRALGMKNVGHQLASLPLYDINHVYVDAEAVTRYSVDLSKAPVDTRVLDHHQLHRLMVGYDHLLGL